LREKLRVSGGGVVFTTIQKFLPEDHDRGRVVWLRPRQEASGQDFDQVVLLDDVGRVADAQPADFDGDGDIDIVVAVFGWHTTGNVLLLTQLEPAGGQLRFETSVIDPRSGAIHVPVADLNGDNRPDFVVVYSQEHESVEACINRDGRTFDKQVLYRAGDPSHGSTGIRLVDLDGDGDQDVLYTNGDTFDSYYVKPSHSIRWLENRGDLTWKDHLLASMPGVSRALSADLDGDGDLDVAACSFIPAQSIGRHPEVASFSSLVWLEQQPGRFLRHEIESNRCNHAALELADVNHDGALDLVVGNFGQSPTDRLRPLTVWLNRSPAAALSFQTSDQ
ncbi:MAG: FG-GAP-like repeat-containing protein, partial [Planctomycetaceae bacterium]|nr:FG-GAP-like repeat-containing protein [Planctomycetaceae bacterium]